MRKKAAIGSTLTWIVAIVIILFLMTFFVLAVGLIKVKFNFLGYFKNTFSLDESYNPVIEKNLINFLNSRVVDGAEKSVYKMIITMTEQYLNEDFLKEAKIDDINLLYKKLAFPSGNIKELLLKYEINEADVEAKNKEIITRLDIVLNNPSKEYLIKIPIGYLYKPCKGSLIKVSEDNVQTLGKEGFGAAEIKIPYGRHIIKVVYKEREICKE